MKRKHVCFCEACFGLSSNGKTLCEGVSIRASGKNGGASFGQQFSLPVDDDNKNYSPGAS
jgi:hypothetical protein